jgi:hypothetical protein
MTQIAQWWQLCVGPLEPSAPRPRRGLTAATPRGSLGGMPKDNPPGVVDADFYERTSRKLVDLPDPSSARAADAAPHIEETCAETRSVHINVPSGDARANVGRYAVVEISVTAARWNHGAWEPGHLQLEGARVTAGNWSVVREAIDRAFAEHGGRFEHRPLFAPGVVLLPLHELGAMGPAFHANANRLGRIVGAMFGFPHALDGDEAAAVAALGRGDPLWYRKAIDAAGLPLEWHEKLEAYGKAAPAMLERARRLGGDVVGHGG